MEPTISTPTYQGFGETRVPMPPSEIQCDWCCDMATSKIIEPCSLDGVAYACVVHGTEWYPHLFPESDTTPIEEIVEEAGVPTVLAEWELEIMRPIWEGVSLVKEPTTAEGILGMVLDPSETELAKRRLSGTPRPWYPLMGHREGLRRNDPVTLASALFILALEGGTAHRSDVLTVGGLFS